MFKKVILSLCGILFAAFLIRIQNIQAPFFYDESVYVNLAQNPFHSDFYPDKIFFRHPPLHYFLLAAVGSLTNFSEVSMRLLSILAACGTIIMTYLLGKEYGGRTIGLLAASLLSLSVIHQQYSQAATMYALLCFFVTLTIYGIKKGNNHLIFSGFILAVYTHYFGFYLAPPIAIYYIHKFQGDWKKIFKRASLFALPYLPWVVIMIYGILYHANRTAGLRWWDFHITNLLLHGSAAIFIGLLLFSWKNRKNKTEQPILVFVWLYILTAFFLIPFRRYLIPFLPTIIVLGVVGLKDFYRIFMESGSLGFLGKMPRKLVPLVLILAGLFLPNPQAYGVYPQTGRYLDMRDTIFTQEWREVVNTIPAGSIATHNIRSLLFYGNLKNTRNYSAFQFDENLDSFKSMIESEKFDWIVIQEYNRYEPLLAYIQGSSRYNLYKSLEYTKIFKKNRVNN